MVSAYGSYRNNRKIKIVPLESVRDRLRESVITEL